MASALPAWAGAACFSETLMVSSVCCPDTAYHADGFAILVEGGGGCTAACENVRFRNFHFKQFLLYLIPAILYPVYAYVSSEQKLLKCMDALTIMGLVFLILGVIFSLMRHGDFDIAEYVTRRTVQKGDIKPYAAFKEDKQEKRKDSFNYPFFTGIVLLLAAGAMAAFIY